MKTYSNCHSLKSKVAYGCLFTLMSFLNGTYCKQAKHTSIVMIIMGTFGPSALQTYIEITLTRTNQSPNEYIRFCWGTILGQYSIHKLQHSSQHGWRAAFIKPAFLSCVLDILCPMWIYVFHAGLAKVSLRWEIKHRRMLCKPFSVPFLICASQPSWLG